VEGFAVDGYEDHEDAKAAKAWLEELGAGG
jgi:hypothetical protein